MELRFTKAEGVIPSPIQGRQYYPFRIITKESKMKFAELNNLKVDCHRGTLITAQRTVFGKMTTLTNCLVLVKNCHNP